MITLSQNLIDYLIPPNISWTFLPTFLVILLTDRQTNQQTNKSGNITSLGWGNEMMSGYNCLTSVYILVRVASSELKKHVRLNSSDVDRSIHSPPGNVRHRWRWRRPEHYRHGLAHASVAGDFVRRSDRSQHDGRRRELRARQRRGKSRRQRVDLDGGGALAVPGVCPAVGVAAPRLPGDDRLRQCSRLPQRLPWTQSAHRYQLLHRVTGRRRHHGRHTRHAFRRLCRGRCRNYIPKARS